MSGEPVIFIGDAMAVVVQGVIEVTKLLGRPPVVVGGLAVLARLSNPYRATVDLDVVDRGLGPESQLEVLRSAPGADAQEPATVLLSTPLGEVKVDVLEVRRVELDHPSDDPGDRLHAQAHAWASETATELEIKVHRQTGDDVQVKTPVAQPGPLVAMKLQAIMNRGKSKQGTDLLDIVNLSLDGATQGPVLDQLASVANQVASDIEQHVDLWFRKKQRDSLGWIRAAGRSDMSGDDLDLVADLLLGAVQR